MLMKIDILAFKFDDYSNKRAKNEYKKKATIMPRIQEEYKRVFTHSPHHFLEDCVVKITL